MVAAPNLLTPRKWPTGPSTFPTAPADTFMLALRIEKAMPPRQKAGQRRGKSCPTAPLARLLPRSVPSVKSSGLWRSVVRPQAGMPFSCRVRSSDLSQLASIFLAISSSSERFWRAAWAVSVSPAFCAKRSSSW
jgi:hypothetical protein